MKAVAASIVVAASVNGGVLDGTLEGALSILAASSAQIKQLWTKVGELLGDEPTTLEREALAIERAKEA